VFASVGSETGFLDLLFSPRVFLEALWTLPGIGELSSRAIWRDSQHLIGGAEVLAPERFLPLRFFIGVFSEFLVAAVVPLRLSVAAAARAIVSKICRSVQNKSQNSDIPFLGLNSRAILYLQLIPSL
jgi:hypothetical protein